MKESPSFALKMVTSLGFCLIFAPYIWRLGWDHFVVLFGALSFAGVWGFVYSRNQKKSRAGQDWELFFTAFYVLAAGLTILGLTRFQVVGGVKFMPWLWGVSALITAVAASFLTFRYGLEGAGRGERILIYVGWPLLTFGGAIGVLTYFNGVLDFHPSRIHVVTIQNKRIDRGRNSRGPLLKVAFWHDASRSEEVRVLYGDWADAQIGGSALVRVKPGFLGAE